jgi:hypothetical protein
MLTIRKNSKNKFELLDNSTGLKITEEIFDEVLNYGNLYIARNNSLGGIYNKEGKLLTKELAQMSFTYNSPSKSIFYKKAGFWGVVTQEYSRLSPIGENIEFVKPINGHTSSSFIIKTPIGYTVWNSKRLKPLNIQNTIVFYRNGYFFLSEKSKKYLFDYELNTEFSEIDDFQINEKYKRIFIEKNDITNIYDLELKLIESNFQCISRINNGFCIAIKDNNCGLIDINGVWIDGFHELDYEIIDSKPLPYWQYHDDFDNFITIKKNNLYGLFSTVSDSHVEPISLDPISFFNNNAIIQTKEKRFGLLNLNFEWIISPDLLDLELCVDYFKYDRDRLSQCGFPYIAKHPETLKYGLISYNGQWITEPDYDMIYYNEKYSIADADLFYLKFDKGDEKGVITIFGKEIFCEAINWSETTLVEDEDEEYLDLSFLDETDRTNFRIEQGFTYNENDIPTEGVRFPVIKEGINGYYDAYGVFHINETYN